MNNVTKYHLTLLLRSVYLKGMMDGRKKIADVSWEESIIKQIDDLYSKKSIIRCHCKGGILNCEDL